MNEVPNEAPSIKLNDLVETLGNSVTNLAMDVTSGREADHVDRVLVKSIVSVLEILKESHLKHAPILELAALRDYLLILNGLLQGEHEVEGIDKELVHRVCEMFEVEGIDKEVVQRDYEMVEGILLDRRRMEMAMRKSG